MGKGIEGRIFYFDRKGPVNTNKTLEIALACCNERNIKKIVIASSTGETSLKLQKKARGSVEIIAVTYCAGSRFREEVEGFERNRDLLVSKGISIVRGLHALSGVERGFEGRYKSGLIPLNLVSDTLRMFSQGVKVCVEISVMAAEHGFITPDEDIVAVGGSGKGSDTAMVIRPAFAANFFDTKIKAVLCMPE
ncbi:MAG TPA: pyruvate kinase alpha/beta domain-containing protein [Desulfatiglandales bacterium]|nr:pyruvate kinase alpha/beta domain-containing protein [Desulfatiglandales bacterium]